jgi:hypothetical protein
MLVPPMFPSDPMPDPIETYFVPFALTAQSCWTRSGRPVPVELTHQAGQPFELVIRHELFSVRWTLPSGPDLAEARPMLFYPDDLFQPLAQARSCSATLDRPILFQMLAGLTPIKPDPYRPDPEHEFCLAQAQLTTSTESGSEELNYQYSYQISCQQLLQLLAWTMPVCHPWVPFPNPELDTTGPARCDWLYMALDPSPDRPGQLHLSSTNAYGQSSIWGPAHVLQPPPVCPEYGTVVYYLPLYLLRTLLPTCPGSDRIQVRAFGPLDPSQLAPDADRHYIQLTLPGRFHITLIGRGAYHSWAWARWLQEMPIYPHPVTFRFRATDFQQVLRQLFRQLDPNDPYRPHIELCLRPDSTLFLCPAYRSQAGYALPVSWQTEPYVSSWTCRYYSLYPLQLLLAHSIAGSCSIDWTFNRAGTSQDVCLTCPDWPVPDSSWRYLFVIWPRY